MNSPIYRLNATSSLSFILYSIWKNRMNQKIKSSWKAKKNSNSQVDNSLITEISLDVHGEPKYVLQNNLFLSIWLYKNGIKKRSVQSLVLHWLKWQRRLRTSDAFVGIFLTITLRNEIIFDFNIISSAALEVDLERVLQQVFRRVFQLAYQLVYQQVFQLVYQRVFQLVFR